MTFAQIVDGMPLASTYAEDHWFHEGLPVMEHEHLCPGVLEKTQRFRSEFDIYSLYFQPKLLQAYQSTVLGSKAWKLRLLELCAIACHDIAVYLYQLDDGVHKQAEWADWRDEKLASLAEDAPVRERNKCGPPTPFYANGYLKPDRFYNGLADVVGYWAEMRIFGGAVLFDRGETEDQCNGIYIHRTAAPKTLAPPTEKQFHDLITFLISPSSDSTTRCPLPIEVTVENKWRWDPYDGMTEHHIFKFRQEIPEDRPRTRCIRRTIDWPEIVEYEALREEYRKKEAGEPSDVEGARKRLAQVITPSSIYWDGFSESEMLEIQPDERKRGRPPYFFDP